MYTERQHPMLGPWKFQGAPFRLDGEKVAVKGPPPMIGEHTANIMIGLLGMSRDDLLDGYDHGVFWPESRPRYDYVQKAIDKERAK
jgi:crotonobetainyl-CoA:carnitine CoA-transferase CaiB-like acyl-CoA transferase